MLRVYSPSWETQWAECREGVRGCVQNKRELVEALNEALRPFRDRRAQLSDEDVLDVLKAGAEQARAFASGTMDEVRRAMGLA